MTDGTTTKSAAAVKTTTPLVWLLGVCVLLSQPVRPAEGEESRREPWASTAVQYEMPERLRRQVAPAPSTPWRTPDLHGYTSVLKTAEPPPIDPQRRYELVELIDLAERVNPETRVAWEAARQAAIGVGLVESEYFPVLTLTALGGYQSTAFPAPKDVAPSGFCRVNLEQVVPVLNLRVFSSPCQVQTPKRRCALMVEATTVGTMVSHVVSPDWMRASTSLVGIESRRLS